MSQKYFFVLCNVAKIFFVINFIVIIFFCGPFKGGEYGREKRGRETVAGL